MEILENYNKAIANYKEAYDFYAARALEVLANVTAVKTKLVHLSV